MAENSDPADFTEKGDCPACQAVDVLLKDVNGMLICEKCASKRFSSKVRKSIQEAFDKQQAQRQRESWHKRIAIARKGMGYYEDSKFNEALRAFREYLAILEHHHSVPPGGLRPSVFDQKKEAGELLLISGIYWDLAKIFDRIKGKQVDLRISLNKFYEFSVGRPHVILASEAMRRYIASDKCIHKEDFNNTHRLLRNTLVKCFIASAVFGPLSPEVTALQLFRDETLLPSTPGRVFVALYYRVSPPIARALLRVALARVLARTLLTPIARYFMRVPIRDGRK